MGPRPHTLLAIALAMAVGLAGLPAAAQSPSGTAPNRGPAARDRGFSYGGEITGRMNLLAPREDGAPRPPTLPAPRPDALGAPDDGGGVDMLNGLNLPGLKPAPKAPAQPTIPPTPAVLPAPTAPLRAPVAKQALALSAAFAEKGPAIPSGVKWRVFTEQPDANGEHMMVAESEDAAPMFELDPGGYVVHAVYGLVGLAKAVTVPADGPARETVVIPAGAMRLTAMVGDVRIPAERIGFSLTRDDAGVTRKVAENVKPGTTLRLPAGRYHVVSAYGDANAIVEVDVDVAAGKFVEAQVHHKAARVALKLVRAPGGPELADTSWTVLTPGGDVIRESIGKLPPIVLSEGDYVAIARRDGRTFQQNFAVRAGADSTVELSGG